MSQEVHDRRLGVLSAAALMLLGIVLLAGLATCSQYLESIEQEPTLEDFAKEPPPQK